MSKKSNDLKFSTEQDLKRKFLAELILMDDIFMRVVLKDVKCTEFILQTILEKPELRVKSQSIQSDLKNLEGRSLVLDCLCTDKEGTIYNIELQNDSLGASPKRIYHISRIIKESGAVFPDQTNIIYVNTSKSSSNELGKLIEDFYTADPKKMHSKILAKRVSKLKIAENLEKGDEKAMTTYYDRLKRQWKKEGTEEGMAKGMAKGLAEGLEKSEDIMAKLMGILVKEGRIDDLAKASEDKSYRKSLLKEFQLI